MEEKNTIKNNKAWVVAVNMGYGHQRTAYPLKKVAFDNKIINANSYKGIPEKDKKIWKSSRNFYEFISRFKKIPFIGDFIFYLYNKIQEIPNFYPRRDLSKSSLLLRKMFSIIIKKEWGKHLIEKLKKKKVPFITTFFTSAFMAEIFDYPRDIYCVICDADIARAWAPLYPKKSRIKYFAPNSWTRDRLKLYGVKPKNIFLTGFPLPIENIGTEEMEILKNDLRYRLFNLDPKKEYSKKYNKLIEINLGPLPKVADHPLTILFSIGGAGAQKEMAIRFVKNLSERIKKGEIKIILSAGIREKVRDYFWEEIQHLGLKPVLDKNIEILYDKDIYKYFDKFNQKLRKTDILWTKPSELSFYSGLGVPIMIAPSIGSQEDLNRKWLLRVGSGIAQGNPNYVDQWLFDCINGGRFAEAAMEGFIKIEKKGVYNIEKIISNETY
ncbi:MAG: hypothetical protein ABH956_01400 [Candidatus Nealsonbacteria bacterium]